MSHEGKVTTYLGTPNRDLLYADGCALTAHTQADTQHLFNRFRGAAIRFGLTISLKKTKVLWQPVDRLTSTPPVVMAGETALPVVQRFCYLGSMLLSDANIDEDISSRITKASYSFGRLTRRLWDDHGKLQGVVLEGRH